MNIHNNNNNNFIYFNLSDLVNYSDSFSYDFKMLEEYEHRDRFNGFFFNIRNITKAEIENFLMFFGGTLSMLENFLFLKNFIFFVSLFYNQSLLFFFMFLTNINELYSLFSNNSLSKISIKFFIEKFNKRVLLETYRFFLTFVNYFKKISFKKFKKYILSESFFFDSNYSLYHYYYFIDSFLIGFDLYYRYYSSFFTNVFMERLTFLEIIEYLCDSLIYNLSNLNINLLNLNFSLQLYKNELNFLGFINYFNYLKYINNYLNIFVIIHELFSFFRLYLYIFFIIINKQLKKKNLYKFFKIFKKKYIYFLDFYKYYKNYFFYTILIKLFNIIQFFIFKYLISKIIKINDIFIFYNFLKIKVFNLFRFNFLDNIINLKNKFLFIRYNNYILNLFYNFNNFVNLNFFNFFFSYVNINKSDKSNIKLLDNFFFLFFKTFNFSFDIKYNFYCHFFFKYIQYLTIFQNNYIYKFYTLRTFFNFNDLKNNFIISNLINFKLNSFINRYNFVITFFFNFSFLNILLDFFYLYKIYIYVPLEIRIKNDIEDFFFIISEDLIVEGFEFYLDNIDMDENETSDIAAATEDAEDDEEILENFFEIVEHDNLPFLVYIEDILFYNYYVYDIVSYKYDNYINLTENYSNFGQSWEFDYLYYRYVPYLLKNILISKSEDFSFYMNTDMWYNWVSFCLTSDLTAYDINYYKRAPDYYSITNNKIINTLAFGRRFNYLNPNYKGKFINIDSYFDSQFYSMRNYFPDYLFNQEMSHAVRDKVIKKANMDEKNAEYYKNKEHILFYLNKEEDYEFFEHEGNNIIQSDDHIFTNYTSFNNLFNFFMFKEKRALDLRADEDYTPFYETGVRDLVILNDIWIWWEYINNLDNNSTLKKNFLKQKIKPTNIEELLFLNTYILSGLPLYIDSVVYGDKKEKKTYMKILDEIILLLYNNNNDEVLKKYDITKIDYELQRALLLNFEFNSIEYYYNYWFNLYNNMLFVNDYSTLIEFMYYYDEHVYPFIPPSDEILSFYSLLEGTAKNKKLDSVLVNYSRKLENEFSFLLSNIFKSIYVSFYDVKLKSKLIIFWEHFYLNTIEVMYSLLDFNPNRLFESMKFYLYTKEFIHDDFTDRNDVIRHIDYIFNEKEEQEDDVIPESLNLYLADINDPYLLIFNGLNINMSFAEMLFFDLYESNMLHYTDALQDEYNYTQLNNFKFFEFDDVDIRTLDIDYFSKQSEMLRDKFIEDRSFEYYEERVALTSVGYNNYYIGESYDLYLKRYYSVYSYNYFLYGLLNTYLQKVSIMTNNLLFSNLSYNYIYSDEVFQKNYYYFFLDINHYKLELLFYYLIYVISIIIIKIKNFNKYFLFLLLILFINFIYKIKLSNYYKFFFILFYLNYFYYLIIFFFKKHLKLKLNSLTINNLTIKNFYLLIKFLLKNLFSFFKLFINFFKFYYYKYIFYKSYKILIKFYKNNFFFSLFKLFKDPININKLFLYKNSLNIKLKYNKFNSFRSITSTFTPFINNNNVFNNSINLYKYLINKVNVNKLSDVIKNNQLNLIKNNNYNLYYYTNFLQNFNITKYDIDSSLFDLYDSIKDGSYHDYEDNLFDDTYDEDEWYTEFPVGDVTDNFDEELNHDNIDVQLDEEELSAERNLDPLTLHLYYRSDTHSYNFLHNKIDSWDKRFDYFFTNIYYLNYKFIKFLFIKLLNYYKLNVPITTGIEIEEYFRYNFFDHSKELLIEPPNYVENYPFLDLIKVRSSNFLNKKRVNKYLNKTLFNNEKDFKDKYDILIPKYFNQNIELYEIFDYFIDFNINDGVETNFLDINFIDMIVNKLDILDINSTNVNFLILQFINFCKYIYIYIYIGQYLDFSGVNKLFLYIFYLFDLMLLFLKIINILKLKKKKFYKFIFNKCYMYIYNKHYNNYMQKLKNNNFNFINNKYTYIYDINLIYKKILLLKSINIQFINIFSYILLLKGLDFFKFFFFKKKDYYKFFIFLKKTIIFYESIMYINLYKLAQIYSKYGLNEAIFFFNNLSFKILFNNNITYLFKFYKLLNFFIFCYEFIIYLIMCFILLMCTVNISVNIFFGASFWPQLYRTYDEGEQVMVLKYHRFILDNKYSYLINLSWLDLWGIF
jgi:hypothetical protein